MALTPVGEVGIGKQDRLKRDKEVIQFTRTREEETDRRELTSRR